jgi:abequosyltransferase
MRPTLSICIATFNRGAFLAETLDSLVNQVRQDVEIVIVDGASTDDTPQRVAIFEARVPELRYHREAQNSGIDQDFDKAVQYATGKYVWLMTDDDIARPDAIGRILEATRAAPDLIVVNSEVRDATLTRTLNERLIDVDADRSYCTEESTKFFLDCATGLTFIGGVVIARELWLDRDRQSYYGTLFLHVGVIFQSAVPLISVIAEPLILIRYGVAMWTPRAFEIWMYLWPRLVWSFEQYDERTKARVIRREPWRSYSKLIHYRAKGAFSLNESRKHFGSESPMFRTIAALIAFTPRQLALLASLAYLALRNDANRVPVYDLVREVRPDALRRMLRRAFAV